MQDKYTRVAATGIPLDTNHQARARRFGVPYENINRQLVFERDGWICRLCGDPVDREAKYPALMMATLDHIVPLSRGPGSPGHVYGNVWCAHLLCNMIKNDERPRRRGGRV